MRKPEKLSDQALENSIKANWQDLLSATRIQRFVRKGFLILGLGCAVALPLLNTKPTETLVGPQGVQGEQGVQGKQGIPGQPITTGSAGTNNIHVLSVMEMEIQSAPASKIWHRSVFQEIGDEFWALPDSSFKLKLIAPLTKPCTQTYCDATFEVSFNQFQGVVNNPYEIKLYNKKRAIRMLSNANQTPPSPNICRTIDDPTPYLLCRLRSSTPAPSNDDVCLWLRRSTKGESGDEVVALEIRWEMVSIPGDRGCGGEFDRDPYEPTLW